MAPQKSAGEAKKFLTILAAWTHGHEARFKKIRHKAFEEYAQMPWGG